MRWRITIVSTRLHYRIHHARIQRIYAQLSAMLADLQSSVREYSARGCAGPEIPA